MIVKSSELTRTRREVGRRNGKKGEKVLMDSFLKEIFVLLRKAVYTLEFKKHD